MKAPLLLPKNLLYPVALFGLIFSIITVSFDFTNYGISLEAGKFLTYFAILCSFVTVVVLIVDVFKNNLSSKYLWTLAFLISGCIAGLYYLMNREKYIGKTSRT